MSDVKCQFRNPKWDNGNVKSTPFSARRVNVVSLTRRSRLPQEIMKIDREFTPDLLNRGAFLIFFTLIVEEFMFLII